MLKSHPFHLVSPSPWPLGASLCAMLMAMGLVVWFHVHSKVLFYVGVTMILLTMLMWWRDVIREVTYMGNHTLRVQSGLQLGMILFITSEIMFFFAFFWGFFHSSLSPCNELGCVWPPIGISPLNPFGIPLLNTAVLLASGATVTWAHYGLLNNYKCEFSCGLFVTVMLGVYFTDLQLGEYSAVEFSIADSVYGSTFFLTTGFHGLHVLIGSAFLLVCYVRGLLDHFSASHHKGFEFAAWYWHFVDVVWIMLYISIYWWAS